MNPFKFHHSSLADSANEIRLLEICPGADDDQILSRLSTHSAENPPQYHAISYAWGSADDPVTILVDDKTLKVNHNCWYALWQIRHSRQGGLVWIDSICINQTDLQENSTQVQGIHRIFQNAEYVLASLGPECDDSEFLMECLQRYRLPEIRDPILAKQGVIGDEVQRRVILWLVSLGEYFGRFASALKLFSRRSFFTRLWIYQEVFLASSIRLICGTKETNMQVLKDLVEVGSKLIVHYRPFQEYDFKEASVKLMELCQDNQLDLIALNDKDPANQLGKLPVLVERLRQEGVEFAVQDFFMLPWILDSVQRLECQDPRDKIFGLVSTFGSGCRIAADYIISTFQLALNVLHAYSFFESNSCVQLADLLCVNLRLDSVVQCSSRAEPSGRYVTLQSSTPWACQVSHTESGLLTAPFQSPWSLQSDTLEPLKNPLQSRTTPSTLGVKPILVKNRPVALVSSEATSGDWIVPLSHYTSSYYRNYRLGLILRQRAGSLYSIVGEAAFYSKCRPCYSHENCACQFGADSHPRFATYFAISFDSWELLLLAARFRRPYAAMQHETQYVDDYEPQLPDSPFPLSESTTAVRHDSYQRIVQKIA